MSLLPVAPCARSSNDATTRIVIAVPLAHFALNAILYVRADALSKDNALSILIIPLHSLEYIVNLRVLYEIIRRFSF